MISIDIENRTIKDKEHTCYIPKINGVPVLGTGYIFKESVSKTGEITDNLELAKSILKSKINEINEFIKSNNVFFADKLEKL
jgi:hypothetical protein